MNRVNTNNFDFLRVVFALTVAISHIIVLTGIETFQPYGKYFHTPTAISGFFIISGFLIAKSYENVSNIKTYIIRRINRIIPAYFFVIICCAIGLFFVSNRTAETYFLSEQFWKYLVANFSFQNYIEPNLPGVFIDNSIIAVNGALWTIKVEEAFYLLLPVFYWLFRKKGVNIIWLSILLYLASRAYYHYFSVNDMYKIAKQLPGALSYFLIGILLFRNFDKVLNLKNIIIVPALLIFGLEYFITGTSFLRPISFGVIVFYAAYSFKFLNRFGKYGDFTYGIYIYHFPIIQLAITLGYYKAYNPLLVSVIILLLVFVLAVFSWYFLELKFLSKARQHRQKELLFGSSKIET